MSVGLGNTRVGFVGVNMSSIPTQYIFGEG